MDVDNSKRLTMREVADFFGVSYSTVKRWVANKSIVAIQAGAGQTGRIRRFRMQDIRAFEESRLTQPSEPPVRRDRRPKPPQILK